MSNDNNVTNVDLIKILRSFQNNLPISKIIEYFNEHDVDYYGFTDIDMYIHYLELSQDLDDADGE